MHKASLAEIQAYVRHLAFDREEQKIADTKLVPADRDTRAPELLRRSRHLFTRTRIGILNQAAAIEAARTTAAVAIRRTDLVQRNGRRGLTDTAREPV